MGDWAGEARAVLTGGAIEGDIPFRWEGGCWSPRRPRKHVDAVLDGVEETLEAEGLTRRGGSGREPISALFVAVDDLTSHPNDRDAILRLNALFERTEAGPVPFGLHPASWDRILDQVSDLLDLSLESDDAGDVKAEAVELRDVAPPRLTSTARTDRREAMVLAELEVWHSRPITPTRRVALGHLVLPADPPPGFGGLLLGAVVAAHLPGSTTSWCPTSTAWSTRSSGASASCSPACATASRSTATAWPAAPTA